MHLQKEDCGKNTFFERHEFLEFFDTESLKYLDKDEYIEVCDYSIVLENNLIFHLHMIPIEQTLSLELCNTNTKIPIFNFDFPNHDVDRISLIKNPHAAFLNIYKIGENFPFHDKNLDEPYMKIMLKPYFSVKLSF